MLLIKKLKDNEQVVKPDSITKYKTDKIVEEDVLYTIYANGNASNSGNECQCRIKSDKSDFCCKKRNKQKIKVEEAYRLDLRDYKNFRFRTNFFLWH